MNPVTSNKNVKLIQFLTTALLILILVAMIAGYIYYGMYTARQNQAALESESVTAPAVTPGIDEAKRQEIINSLEQEAPSISEEKKDAIVESLTTTESANQMSPEEEAKRQEIINALQQN